MKMESNIDRYEDKTVEKVVDKKVLNKMIWRSLFLQASFNFERMQAAGWLHGLLPGLEKIHKNKEDLILYKNNFVLQGTNDMERNNSSYRIINSDPYLVYGLSNSINGENIDYIVLNVEIQTKDVFRIIFWRGLFL